jgi:hypothetical protein
MVGCDDECECGGRRCTCLFCPPPPLLCGLFSQVCGMQDVDADDAACRWTSPFLCLLSPAELQQIWCAAAAAAAACRECGPSN